MKKTWNILYGIMGTGVGITLGSLVTGKIMAEADKSSKQLSEKHLSLFLMMNQWVTIKQEGKSLISYFDKYNYKRIAIYGMSYAGERLLAELNNSDIKVAYGIDKNANGIYTDIEMYTLEDELPKVDMIVVTSIFFFDEIEEKLSLKVNCPIISLEDIVYQI